MDDTNFFSIETITVPIGLQLLNFLYGKQS